MGFDCFLIEDFCSRRGPEFTCIQAVEPCDPVVLNLGGEDEPLAYQQGDREAAECIYSAMQAQNPGVYEFGTVQMDGGNGFVRSAIVHIDGDGLVESSVYSAADDFAWTVGRSLSSSVSEQLDASPCAGAVDTVDDSALLQCLLGSLNSPSECSDSVSPFQCS